MSAFGLLQSLSRWGLKVTGSLAFLAPLATRLVLGWEFTQTGLGKWQHFDNTVAFFTQLGIPLPAANAALVSSLELVGGICLILGLLTRLMSAGLSSTMVVALLTADRQDLINAWSGAGDAVPTDVVSFVFLLFLLWLIFLGPGPVSLDRWVAKRLGTAG
jgi:putative oxidoreductase